MKRKLNYDKWINLDKKFFSSKLLSRWSLESLAEEEQIMEETDYGTPESDFAEGMDADGFYGESSEVGTNVYDEVPDPEEDGGFNPGEMGEVDVDLEASEGDLVNIMELSGTLMNNYSLNMDKVFKSNKNILDYTGNIKENPLYEKFIDPARKVLSLYSKETQLDKKIDNFMAVLCDKKKMTAIMGTRKSPFIYESLQILCIEAFRELLAVMPIAIKNSMSIEDAAEKFGYTPVTRLVEAMVDTVEISEMFGEKIYFMEPDEAKEMTGTNEAINGTVYAQNAAFESMMETHNFLSTHSATESILNLIEIRNNKSLLEFSLIMKMCIFISGLVEDVNLTASCNSVLDRVKSILTMDPVNGEEDIKSVIDEVINSLRGEVLMPQLNKLADIQSTSDAVIDNTKTEE